MQNYDDNQTSIIDGPHLMLPQTTNILLHHSHQSFYEHCFDWQMATNSLSRLYIIVIKPDGGKVLHSTVLNYIIIFMPQY